MNLDGMTILEEEEELPLTLAALAENVGDETSDESYAGIASQDHFSECEGSSRLPREQCKARRRGKTKAKSRARK